MHNDTQYTAVFRNTGTTPRTLDEAERNATWASPIWQESSEYQDAKEFIKEMLWVAPLVFLVGALIVRAVV